MSHPIADENARVPPNPDPTENSEPTDQSATLASGGDARTCKYDAHHGGSPSMGAYISAASIFLYL